MQIDLTTAPSPKQMNMSSKKRIMLHKEPLSGIRIGVEIGIRSPLSQLEAMGRENPNICHPRTQTLAPLTPADALLGSARLASSIYPRSVQLCQRGRRTCDSHVTRSPVVPGPIRFHLCNTVGAWGEERFNERGPNGYCIREALHE